MAQDLKTGQGTGPMDRLKTEARGFIGALGDRALSSVQDKVTGATDRLTDYVEGGAGPGLMAAVTGAKDMAEGKGPVRSMLGAGFKGVTEKVRNMFGKGGKGGGKGKKQKLTNIVESIDVGVPIELAYNQWTQFADFPGFMKKVENVEQAEEQKLNWKAQVFWSHRSWEATILEQTPEDKIVWRSKGEKGHVDGAVTFHELAPNLTRILVVLEYHPQGLFERTGNIWRAQGRRVRLELKHFRRHVMSEAVLHPDEIEGWRGVIEDGEVVQDHEAALEERDSDTSGDREPTDEEYQDDQREDAEDEFAGRGEETDAEDEYEEADAEDEYEEADAEDEHGEPDAEDEYGEPDEIAPNGRSARERPAARAGEGSRTSGRGRRPSGRQQRSGRPSGGEERPQRTVRRRAGTRGGGGQ
jgi:uncharacterized membrane protein